MRPIRFAKAGGRGTALLLGPGLVLGSADDVAAQAAPVKSQRLPRPYEGAPPLVPHDVEARKGLCQECHGTGADGAPLTPHPTRTHFCVQCHVGQDLSVKPFDARPSQRRR